MSQIISVLSRNNQLIKELQKILPHKSFNPLPIPVSENDLKKSEILITDFDLLGPHLYNLPNTKWVQGTWAGVDKLLPFVDKENLPPYPISRFSGKHFGQLMSEYVIANIINFERNLFQVRDNQLNQEWIQDGKISEHRTINELTVGIMGLGNIGRRIGSNLKFMGATINGFGQRNRSELEYDNSFLSNYYTSSELNIFLKNCDYFINVMPNTPVTTGLLNNDILENCKNKKAIFINIGRGSIVSEESLLKALDHNWLGGAILDVFQQETLSKESRLWKLPQVLITPHVAGQSRAKDIAEQFAENLKIFEQNGPIPALVNFKKGY